MRDCVQLLTDVYVPVGTSLGAVLIRTPYGRDGLIAQLTAGFFASHGYHVVNQSCRGTFGSGGDFDPFSQEIADGADAVAWLLDGESGEVSSGVGRAVVLLHT